MEALLTWHWGVRDREAQEEEGKGRGDMLERTREEGFCSRRQVLLPVAFAAVHPLGT